jgi:Putative MetA-pathway of phenol degradation
MGNNTIWVSINKFIVPFEILNMVIQKCFIILMLWSLSNSIAFSQELEPRAMTNLPIGTNFLVSGYAYSRGNILLDPAIPIENLNSNLQSGFVAYVRSINFFGLSAKVDAIVPYVFAASQASINEEFSTRSQKGIGDLRIRFSFNFLESKAMSISDFKNYKPNKISGISVQVIVPSGSYDADELINIGSNRWVFKSQWGFAKNFDKWIFESYASLWIFTKNTNFLNGNELFQQPLLTLKMHVIRDLPKKMWMSFNVGYGIGGKTEFNGKPRNTNISTARLGLVYALPLAQKHSLKISYATGIRFKRGPDFDVFSISYQYRWVKKNK